MVIHKLQTSLPSDESETAKLSSGADFRKKKLTWLRHVHYSLPNGDFIVFIEPSLKGLIVTPCM